MALSINWNWAVPKIQVSNASEQSMGNALSSVGESIGSLQRARYQKEQQELLDARAEEDRQRRIAEEERIKGVRGQMAERLAGNPRMAATLESLKARQLELQTAIAQIKSKWGM